MRTVNCHEKRMNIYFALMRIVSSARLLEIMRLSRRPMPRICQLFFATIIYTQKDDLYRRFGAFTTFLILPIDLRIVIVYRIPYNILILSCCYFSSRK